MLRSAARWVQFSDSENSRAGSFFYDFVTGNRLSDLNAVVKLVEASEPPAEKDTAKPPTGINTGGGPTPRRSVSRSPTVSTWGAGNGGFSATRINSEHLTGEAVAAAAVAAASEEATEARRCPNAIYIHINRDRDRYRYVSIDLDMAAVAVAAAREKEAIEARRCPNAIYIHINRDRYRYRYVSIVRAAAVAREKEATEARRYASVLVCSDSTRMIVSVSVRVCV